MSRYCVIGAGAAGVSALHQLRAAGHDVDCFEKTHRVGGHWHTDYDALHLITSRDMTFFEDFPMPADYPHFPRRDQIRTYIESYARARGLYEVIQFGTAVLSVLLSSAIAANLTGTIPSGENGFEALHNLPPGAREKASEPLAEAFASTFVWGLVLLAIAFIPALAMALGKWKAPAVTPSPEGARAVLE